MMHCFSLCKDDPNSKLESILNMNTEIKRMLQDNGELPAYAWPGGYPIYYLTTDKDNAVLCPACANKEKDNLEAGGINWEDNEMVCDECHKKIDAAYGE